MIKLRIIMLSLLVLFIGSCSSTNFMGAKKWIGGGTYVERWFLNPEYKDFDIPKGTAFYGSAAEKIKDKFIIKYYISDNKGSEIEIPAKDMWKVKHNGKHYTEQDDDDLFFYIKSENGLFSKYQIADAGCCMTIDEDNKILPIKECYKNGWCKLYPMAYPETLYVKKTILYQGKTILNEESKKELERQRKIALRNKIKVMPAVSPWVTPPHKICVDYGGEVNSRGVCQIDNSGAAYRLCRELGARLPTIEELKVVVVQCGGQIGNHVHNDSNLSYISCYRKRGFSYEYNAYLSSTVHISKFGLKSGKKTMKFGSGVVSSSFGSNSILCRQDL